MNGTSKIKTDNMLGALAVALLDRVEEAFAAAIGRGGSFAAAILTLGARPRLSVSELGAILGLEHSSTVRLLDRLESEELITRGSGADRRAREITLRARGARAFEKLLEARRAAIALLTDGLTKGELRQLETLLGRLLENVADSVDDARQICRLCEHRICVGADCPTGARFVDGANA